MYLYVFKISNSQIFLFISSDYICIIYTHMLFTYIQIYILFI